MGYTFLQYQFVFNVEYMDNHKEEEHIQLVYNLPYKYMYRCVLIIYDWELSVFQHHLRSAPHISHSVDLSFRVPRCILALILSVSQIVTWDQRLLQCYRCFEKPSLWLSIRLSHQMRCRISLHLIISPSLQGEHPHRQNATFRLQLQFVLVTYSASRSHCEILCFCCSGKSCFQRFCMKPSKSLWDTVILPPLWRVSFQKKCHIHIEQEKNELKFIFLGFKIYTIPLWEIVKCLSKISFTAMLVIFL